VREDDERPLAVAVKEALNRQRFLLVLDNMEQVAAAADDIVQLLHHCPGLVLLVTSQVRLRVSGEREYSVQTLASTDAHPSTDDLDQQPHAIQLFVERARSADESFRLNNSNLSAVANICRSLDGLPLAIELAAARNRRPFLSVSTRAFLC
jgi:non-specific serine/threonine protein kinase